MSDFPLLSEATWAISMGRRTGNRYLFRVLDSSRIYIDRTMEVRRVRDGHEYRVPSDSMSGVSLAWGLANITPHEPVRFREFKGVEKLL